MKQVVQKQLMQASVSVTPDYNRRLQGNQSDQSDRRLISHAIVTISMQGVLVLSPGKCSELKSNLEMRTGSAGMTINTCWDDSNGSPRVICRVLGSDFQKINEVFTDHVVNAAAHDVWVVGTVIVGISETWDSRQVLALQWLNPLTGVCELLDPSDAQNHPDFSDLIVTEHGC